MDWKKSFREDVHIKVKEADIEYNRYKKGGELIYLQQACNKIFSAVENFLMMKYNKKVRNFKQLEEIIFYNNADSVLLTEASKIHYFYYNGEVEMLRTLAEKYYVKVRDKLKSRLR